MPIMATIALRGKIVGEHWNHVLLCSIARLVEAAVTTSGMNTSLFAIELEAARDTRHAVATPARPATLPSKVVADQLLSS